MPSNPLIIWPADDDSYLGSPTSWGSSDVTGTSKPASDWIFQLCDRLGNPISNITKSARDRSFQVRLNGLTTVTMRLISDDPAVNGIHTDGYPVLDSGRRTIKAYRLQEQNDGSMSRTLRFFGPIWEIQDTGQADNAFTAIVAYDPMVYLGSRYTANIRQFLNVDAGVIAQTLINETNAIFPTGVTVNSVQPSQNRSMQYQYKVISEAINELANTFNGFDWRLTPTDTEDGNYGYIDIVNRVGSNRPEVIFGWGVAPHNVQQMERKTGMSLVASDLTTIGGANQAGDQIVSTASNPATRGDFGRIEFVNAGYGDITDAGFLAALTADEINFRTVQREIVQFLPTPGSSPHFWDDFDVGDLVQVLASEKLRGGFLGLQRIVGVDMSLDDIGREVCMGIYLLKDS